jgi:16S rRNA A1518/A1519 N6-dimethyltransferase RsmA/KsgA/DIM1 with predicted DNA glycosylase/AP lyase activity
LRKQLTPAEISALDIDPRLRPERITPAEYARMANLLAQRAG